MGVWIFYITEQNYIIICYFALPDQTKKLLRLGAGGKTGSLYFFSLIREPFFFPSLQSLKQNLQDEAMHNGVKWELFTSLTRRERLHAQTKDGSWTIKLGLSIFGISRKTQCAHQSRREQCFKKAFVPPTSSPAELEIKRLLAIFFLSFKGKNCEIASVLNHSWGKNFRCKSTKMKKERKIRTTIKLYVPPLRKISWRAREDKQRSADINSFKFCNLSLYCHWDKGW